MGRYYNGDIEGKFWFGVQNSDDGEYFGAYEETDAIRYVADSIDDANEGVKKCLEKLGKYKKILDEFFKDIDSYNAKALQTVLMVTPDKAKELLVWYARLELGLKIQKCIKENGDCHFEAEI
ncbi:MAG: hypothetical protein ACTSU7_00130 [Candidatus Heimdallarchaeaceae archaeon]